MTDIVELSAQANHGVNREQKYGPRGKMEKVLAEEVREAKNSCQINLLKDDLFSGNVDFAFVLLTISTRLQ